MKRFQASIVAVLALVSLFSLSLSVHAQDNTPVLAAVQNGNLVITGGGTAVTVKNPPNRGFQSLAWNPGGTKLAYIMSGEQADAQIAVTDANGGDPVVLNTGRLESGFPVSWTPDGQVMYVAAGDPSDASKPYQVNIMRIAPESGANPELIGTIEMGVGCGGGSILPGDWLYWEEAGFGGNALNLQYTDYGILHSSTCSGGGLALFAPQGGQDTPLAGDNFMQPTPDQPQQQVGRAILSSDGLTLAAIRTTYGEPKLKHELVLIDVATRNITEVKTAAEPDQLAWLADGSIFYSTQTQKGNLTANLTAEQKANIEKVFGASDMEVPTNEVSIHKLNPKTGDDQVIYTAQAYAIGHMAVTRDGQALVFSQIANMDKWIEGMGNGTLDVINDVDSSAQRAVVPVSVYRLPLAGGDAALIADQLGQFRLKP
jgi:dipeptidyl aminopeptidase/acylaminoacyl peptidase